MRNENVAHDQPRASIARPSLSTPARGARCRWIPFGLTLVMLASLATPAQAVVVELLTDNDLFGGNSTPDDRYSAGLSVTFLIGSNRVSVEEMLFTDRYLKGQRFDETWATVDLSVPQILGWNTYLNLGLVHVGDGIFGESAQNEVHRWLGDETLALEYPEEDEIHPTVRTRFQRDAPLLGWGRLTPTFEASAAIGHKYHAQGTLEGIWRVTPRVSTRAGLGVRYSRSDFEILDPFVREWGPTGELGFTFFERFDVAWSLNRYGTGQRHFRVGFRIPIDGTGKPGGR